MTLERLPACLGTFATIYSSDPTYDDSFWAHNVLRDGCDVGFNGESGFGMDFWLLPDDTVQKGFIIDTGKEQNFTGISLKNTHNGEENNR